MGKAKRDKYNSVALRAYIDARLEAVNLRFELSERDKALALSAVDKRLEGMNEFRATLNDQASTFATREHLDSKVGQVEKDVKVLQLSKATVDGKASQSSVQITFGIAALAIAISALAIVFQVLAYFHH